ncbi:hypothetical protein KBI23_23410 [bacterium]|nr:hypothetical protein [bacterium]MBP9807531.1 hypothetical protein [bacterium]
MIYPSRVLSAACARLGSFFEIAYPQRRISSQNSEPTMWHFAAAGLCLTPIPYFVLCIPFLIFFTAVDLAFNPPSQYFAHGTLVCRDSLEYCETPLSPHNLSRCVASSSSSSSLEYISVNAVPPTYLAGSTSLCNQQSELGTESVAQNIGSMLFPDYFPSSERHYVPGSFGCDDIFQNCIDAAASPIGFWLREGSLVIRETLTPGKVGGVS